MREELLALLDRIETRGYALEVFPGDILNPQHGWTARLTDERGNHRAYHAETPHGAVALLLASESHA